jgi:hypothetical protein
MQVKHETKKHKIGANYALFKWGFCQELKKWKQNAGKPSIKKP